MNLDLRQEEIDVVKEYRRVHKAYISFLAQKAQVNWCKEGDDNTTLFHQSIR